MAHRLALRLAIVVVSTLVPALEADEATLSLAGGAALADGMRPELRVEGLAEPILTALAEQAPSPSQWQGLLSLHLDSADAPAVASRCRVDRGGLVLQPRFPLEGGLKYIAVFRPGFLRLMLPESMVASLSPSSELRLELDVPPGDEPPTTEVEAVFPSSELLPENLLKLYLHFSAPMSQGDAYRYVDIVDQNGRAVELAFIELEHELWDPSGTRLTLLFDPGRIKSGLKPKQEVGPALEGGFDFALVIDEAWPDAAGHPLRAPFRKAFRVSAPDYDSPDPELWQWQRPRAGSREPLIVTVDEPLDRALMARWIRVIAPDGEPLTGRVEIDREETRWTFLPERPWSRGVHEVRVDLRLEDRSGNSVGRPFEVDLEAQPARDHTPEATTGIWSWRFQPEDP